ncbi:hypothetical protein TRFO_21041 [Tritrichomonas foetus]|uniref:Uncharacterized protein n=1 Tax=Tritrichomonas foetus TaxID=1144522 RepID=A0A1J4KJF9_9EUKA|nr:hypothetical protein TRFO_21041 [Tritrichomonas foetus]|eukprot:OHT09948.1 hypothetical protein TRFO_21041 [Tritrichomonas foetus]
MNQFSRNHFSNLLYVIEKTSFNRDILNQFQYFIEDFFFDCQTAFRKTHFFINVLIYWRENENTFSKILSPQFLEDLETISDLLNDEFTIHDSSKVGEGPSDWTKPLSAILNEIPWRDGKKRIFWVSNENSFGKRFCGFDPEWQNPRQSEETMVSLTQQLAQQRIRFFAVNTTKGKDNGGLRTFREMKKIFEENHNHGFSIHQYKIEQPDDNNVRNEIICLMEKKDDVSYFLKNTNLKNEDFI